MRSPKVRLEHRAGRQRLLVNLAPFILLGLFIFIFGLGNPQFLSSRNLYNVARQSSVLLIVALGGTFVIMMGSIDLSVGSILALGGTLTALLIPHVGFAAFALAVVAGGLSGVVNGYIFTKGKIPSFLTTLGTMTLLYGVTLIICGGKTVFIYKSEYTRISIGSVLGGFPNVSLWALGAYGICIFLAFRTHFGRFVYTIGGGETVTEFSGINVNRFKIAAFVLSGLLCGGAGGLLAALVRSSAPRMGMGFILESIAAVVIGGTALSGGVGGPHRTFIGVLVIAMLSNGMNLMGIHQYVQEIIKGVVVLGAAALTIDRSKIEMVK